MLFHWLSTIALISLGSFLLYKFIALPLLNKKFPEKKKEKESGPTESQRILDEKITDLKKKREDVSLLIKEIDATEDLMEAEKEIRDLTKNIMDLEDKRRI